MLTIHLEDQENGGSPTKLGRALQYGQHECTISDESSQMVKRDVLHAECSLYGTELNVPQIEPILALQGVPWDGALVGQHQKNVVKVKCGHLKGKWKIIARVSSAVSAGQYALKTYTYLECHG